MDSKTIMSKMTLEDKISLCTGEDFWRSRKMEQYGIPSFTMSDGPHGLRYQSSGADMIGVNQSDPAICFPTAVTAGATWNTELYAAEGKAIGEDKMMMICATDCPLRAVIISSGGTMSDSLARGLLEMANGHYIRGMKAILKK